MIVRRQEPGQPGPNVTLMDVVYVALVLELMRLILGG